MQKPYRGDYKPDYEKWKKIGKKKSIGFFTILITLVFIVAIGMMIGSFVFDKPVRWEHYSFWKHSIGLNDIDYYLAILQTTVILKIVSVIITFFNNMDNSSYMSLAEQEAEQNYQNDMDRWYYYQDAEDEVEDRKLARDLKRKRAMGQIDDERLIYQYSQLQAIQYQTNQQAVEFFQQAQQALRYDRKSDLDYSLDQLERALGV